MATTATEPTRAALLRVAGELLEEDGLDAVTLREVGRRAGVSRSAPYRHFADKAALLSAVAAADLTWLGERIAGEAARGRTPLRRLERMVAAYLGFAREHPARYRLIYAPRLREDPALQAAAEAAVAAFAAGVEACMDAGELRRGDPRAVGALLVAAVHGAVDLEQSGHLTRAKWRTDAAGIARAVVGALAA
jgi:AcrR family transcriptional regulator